MIIITSIILNVNKFCEFTYYNSYMKRKFAERLRELRQEKKLSYKQLGNLVGLSSSALCNWENGLMDITSDNLQILADFFKVSTDYLLGRED